MFGTFVVMRQLHEMLWYLTELLILEATQPIHNETGSALDDTELLTRLSPASLIELDVVGHREK